MFCVEASPVNKGAAGLLAWQEIGGWYSGKERELWDRGCTRRFASNAAGDGSYETEER